MLLKKVANYRGKTKIVSMLFVYIELKDIKHLKVLRQKSRLHLVG